MQELLNEIKELFENEQYKQALFKASDLEEACLKEGEFEIAKECAFIQAFSLAEMIQFGDAHTDLILKVIDRASSYISSAEELASFYTSCWEHINSRFAQLVPEVLDSIEPYMDQDGKLAGGHQEYMNFFYQGYLAFLVGIDERLETYKEKIGAPEDLYWDKAVKELYENPRTLCEYNKAIELHREILSMTKDFPIYHHTDGKKLIAMYTVAGILFQLFIPAEEKEKEKPVSLFLPKMKGLVTLLSDELNTVTVLDGVFLSLVPNLHTRKDQQSKIQDLTRRIQKYEPNYVAPNINEKVWTRETAREQVAERSGGCYVATAVYGSYDCPQVWTLRRYRDYTLAETWYGRTFIKTYYAVSPTLVKWFGHTEWFKKMWQGKLDRMVAKLQANGVESTPYEDKEW